MKKIRTFLAISIVFAFASGIAFGQASNHKKMVVVSTYEFDNTPIVCSGDLVSGPGEITETYWENGKYQFKIKATYVGLTGNVYELSGVQNTMMKDFVPGQAYSYTDVFTDVIYCNGEEFAMIKVRVHVTINANGEMTSEVDKGGWFWECL